MTSRLRKTLKHSQLDVGGGIRMRHSLPVAYGGMGWFRKDDLFAGVLRMAPRGFWYSDDGWGQSAAVTWTRK